MVIPTYQEAGNIVALLRAIRAACPDLGVIVCDDDSPDGTGRLAEQIAVELGGIEVLHRPTKAGLGAAYRHGFAVAQDRGFDVIGQMDADFSHDPSVLPALVRAVTEGADVAVGSRYVPGGSVPNWTWSRRKLSSWGNAYANHLLRLTFRDATTAFRMYRSEVLDAIEILDTTANGYLFQIETAFRLSQHDLQVVELPITFVDRVEGSSKMAVVRTMVETVLRVTWWGLTMRAPATADRLRRTPPGRYLETQIRPSGPQGRGTEG